MTTVKSLSREMKFFLLALIPIYFISVGLIIQPFDSIVTGIYEIIWEPDFLITDYIAVGGMGAAFVNAGMMALISIYFVYSLGMEMDGHTITSCCLMFGFSLFGKNLMNIWAIFLGDTTSIIQSGAPAHPLSFNLDGSQITLTSGST